MWHFPPSTKSFCFIFSDHFDITFLLDLFLSWVLFIDLPFLCLGIENLERVLGRLDGTSTNPST
ncbi:rCG26219 [Rattus norvegicus]|uniref:RCG26219 n=1 Tax=Rattus norvegicus TaxID=10116 RepID=A6HNU5_RAT|nr:rCG26219 [Rattus norvegicus]